MQRQRLQQEGVEEEQDGGHQQPDHASDARQLRQDHHQRCRRDGVPAQHVAPVQGPTAAVELDR